MSGSSAAPITSAGILRKAADTTGSPQMGVGQNARSLRNHQGRIAPRVLCGEPLRNAALPRAGRLTVTDGGKSSVEHIEPDGRAG